MNATHAHGDAHPRTHRHLYVAGSTPLHRAAAEAKLLGALVFMIVVAATPRTFLGALIADMAIVAIVLAVIKIPPATVLARALVVSPVLVLAAALPLLAAGPKTPLGPFAYSSSGAQAGAALAIKALCGVGVGIVVTATTTVNELITGLGRLRVPNVFVAILSFLVRYLDILVADVAKMRQSMVARCHDPRWLWHIRPIAQSAGSLFVRSYERGERIHQAMLARGYTGQMPTLERRQFDRRAVLICLWPAIGALGAIAISMVGQP